MAESSDPPRRAVPRVSWLRVAFGVLVTGLLFAGLTRLVGSAQDLGDTLTRLDLRYLAASVLTAAAALATTALRMRWALLVGGDDVSWRRCLTAILAAWPVSAVTPSRAGDFYRAAYLRREVPPLRGVAAVLAEKLVDAIMLFAVATGGALLADLPVLAAVAGAFAGGGLLALFWSGWARWLDRLPRRVAPRAQAVVATTTALRAHPRLLARLTLASAAVLALTCGHLWLLLHATGRPFPYPTLLASWPLAMLAGALPLTPAGLGTRDAAFVALIGVSAASSSVVVATFLYGMTSWMYALVGLPLLLASDVLRRPASSTLDRS